MKVANKQWFKRALGMAGVASLSLAGLTVPAWAAYSAGTDGDTTPNFGNIKPTSKGSLTIYKHEFQTGDSITEGDPSSKDTDSLSSRSKPVKDVVFTYYKLDGINLTGAGAADNWNKLSELSKDQTGKIQKACDAVSADTPTNGAKLEGFTLDSGISMAKTDQSGKAQATDLALGAYLVCETKAPANVVKKAEPFVVTIPYPDNTRKNGKTNKWLYDVTVYPKNSVGGITKTIEEQSTHGYGLGSEVHFPVEVTIPAKGSGEHFEYLIVEDPMDERFEEIDVASAQIISTSSTSLQKDTDYKVTPDTNVGLEHKVTFALTKTGLEKIGESQYAGKKLQVVFKGKVKKLDLPMKTSGVIDNIAKYYLKVGKEPPTDPPTTPPTTPPGGTPPTGTTPKVTTNWGDALIKKVDKDNTGTGLKGAEFEVYEAVTPYPDSEDCTGAQKKDSAITVGGSNKFTSNDDGMVNIQGLFVSDSEHEKKNANFRCYVLVETKAPDGFVLPSSATQPLKVNIGKTTSSTPDLTIENSKPIVPGLPLTGANGRILLGIIGAAVVALGVGGYIVKRRREA